ncbi:hypothetical protein BGI39_08895 [Snodgrassella communis]|nr:hypothetical protein BGI31_04250 [Snodgrassella communis]PIT10244.1 hypothetical protein BGI29_04665 [Snodgrassella communis]PIT25514.1 hypothetical protein BGI38_10350 [Snodgrassella communis]PIT27113.1 hypothetical protein BGI39_08895 [Snodgrassella communis]
MFKLLLKAGFIALDNVVLCVLGVIVFCFKFYVAVKLKLSVKVKKIFLKNMLLHIVFYLAL